MQAYCKLIVAVLGVTVFLSGCGFLGPLEPVSPMTVPAGPADIGRLAQNAVNEANVTLAAAAGLIGANVKAKVWTPKQAQGYLDKVRDYAKRVDRAQELVHLGQFADAKAQADATRALILLLHTEVAAQARKESK